MNLTDLPAVTAALNHAAHLTEYLRAFEQAYRNRHFDAIPGAPIQLTASDTPYTVTSYVILNDQRFTDWHEQIIKDLLALSFDPTVAATPTTYEHLTPELFALFAQQGREHITAVKTPERKSRRRKEDPAPPTAAMPGSPPPTLAAQSDGALEGLNLGDLKLPALAPSAEQDVVAS